MLAELVQETPRVHAGLVGHFVDPLLSEHVAELIRGNRLVRTAADPGLGDLPKSRVLQGGDQSPEPGPEAAARQGATQAAASLSASLAPTEKTSEHATQTAGRLTLATLGKAAALLSLATAQKTAKDVLEALGAAAAAQKTADNLFEKTHDVAPFPIRAGNVPPRHGFRGGEARAPFPIP